MQIVTIKVTVFFVVISYFLSIIVAMHDIHCDMGIIVLLIFKDNNIAKVYIYYNFVFSF